MMGNTAAFGFALREWYPVGQLGLMFEELSVVGVALSRGARTLVITRTTVASTPDCMLAG